MHDHAAATHLFRIAQEAVSNAVKHGKARRVGISLRDTRGRIVLRVSDNGKGFPKRTPKNKGMGLRIMQSRAGMIGGAIAIERNNSGGMNVTCAVPQNGPSQKPPKNHAR
jgi:signal transduction histidine kinase